MNDLTIPPPPAHALSRFFWPLAVAGSLLAAWVITALFPVYFRADDVGYLQWAASHTWRDCFHPDTARLFGMFRPMQNVCWKFLFDRFGLDPAPYQFVLGCLYFLSLSSYLALLNAMHRRGVGVAGLVVYLASFYYLQYILFWFADFTYVIELFFLHAALLFFWKMLTARAVSGLGFVFAFAGALMSKEPAAAIVPCVTTAMLWCQWPRLSRERRRLGAATVVAAGGASALWLLATGSLASRVAGGDAGGAAPAPSVILERWSFYASTLGGGGLLLVLLLSAAFAATVCRSARGRIVLFVALAVAGLLLRRIPGLWLAAVLCVVAVVALRNPKLRIGAAWFAVPLCGIMVISYVVRTYLVEAAFGAGVLMTSILDTFERPRLSGLRRRLSARTIAAAAGVAIVLGGLALVMVARSSKFEALRTLSASRVATGRAVEWMLENRDGHRVVIVTYDDMGVVYERDFLPLPDLDKARVQKCLTGAGDLKGLLDLHGGRPIEVSSLKEFLADAAVSEARVFVATRREKEFLDAQPVKKELLHEIRNDRAYAAVYLVSKRGS